MLARSERIEKRAGFSIWEMGLDRLEELTEFVFGVYYGHFGDAGWTEPTDDLAHMLQDDQLYAASARVFAAIGDSGAILSTARALERRRVPLPIERDFHVPLQRLARERLGYGANHIYEVARLATSSQAIVGEALRREVIPDVTDAVVVQVIRATSGARGNFWTASMDNRALGLFRHRGFAFEQVAETDPCYLGSPTTPVLLSIDACRDLFAAAYPAKLAHYFGVPSLREMPLQPQLSLAA